MKNIGFLLQMCYTAYIVKRMKIRERGEAMGDDQIQWHPGFMAAMILEFLQNKDDLRFEKEYNLNVKPLEIDMLIIKKKAEMQIDNDIGHIFRGHNIIEYKDPGEHLDIDVFYKVQGYACLYKSYGKTVNEVSEDDITMTLIRETKPVGLFRYFNEHGYRLSNPDQGIYYIEGRALFPAQIIVSKELEPQAHIWLKALSGKLNKQNMRSLLERIKQLNGKYEKEMADAVLEVSMKANVEVMEELTGDDKMSDELLQILEPIFEPIVSKKVDEAKQQLMQQGIEQGIEQGIQGTVFVLRSFGHNDNEIKLAIAKQYSLSEEETKKYV